MLPTVTKNMSETVICAAAADDHLHLQAPISRRWCRAIL